MNILNIPFTQAWAYCFTQPLYVICIISTIIFCTLGIYLLATKLDEKLGSFTNSMLTGSLIVLFLWAIFSRPVNISHKTTKEQAAQGIFIK